MIVVRHVYKVDQDHPAQVAQPELTSDSLSRFHIGIKDGLFQIAMSYKRPGININGGHGFSLVDDQITT